MTDIERVIDLRSLPRDVPGRRASIFAGMLLFIVIEAIVVATLLTSYYYVRVMTDGGWPPAGIEPPEISGPAVSLSVLVASIGPALLAHRFHRNGRRVAFRSALAIGAGLLIAYAGLALHDLFSLPFDWRGHVYGSLVWTISGYQLFHVAALLLLAMGVVLLGSRRRDLPRDAAVVVLVVYWAFVVAAAAPSYFTLYATPHLF